MSLNIALLSKNGSKIRCLSSSILRNFKEQNVSKSYTSIADFYAGKSVFITGATGFLGKVVVEKLLYSCNDIDKVYLLVREKKDDNVNTRTQKMFDDKLFNRLKETKPEVLKKIVAVGGDLSTSNLGINSNDQRTLIENVSVVIHSGATVSFNNPLKDAMNINYEGTLKVLNLCKQMKKLEAFVYISTAYSQSTKKVLEETVYPSPAGINEVYEFLEECGDNEKETKKFLKGIPNTYAFAKAMCENYVAKNCENVPTIIIRPSIVTPTKDGPVSGWLDNWRGISGVLDNLAKGWNRVALGKAEDVLDIIPVDYVSNLTIASAALFDRSKRVSVYNSCSSSVNPIMKAEIFSIFIQEIKERGYGHIPYPFVLYSNSTLGVKWMTIVLQLAPAYLADLCLKIIGKNPKYMEIQSHVLRSRNAIEYYTSQTWLMKCEEARRLFSSLSVEDQNQFPFDPAHLDWHKYIPAYCSGIQKYLKSKVDTTYDMDVQ